MSAWGESWGEAWGASWGGDAPGAEATVDGGRTRRKRHPVKPRDFYRTPEDIRREQLEDERYLASLKKPQQMPATARRGKTGDNDLGQAPEITTPAADPILADVAARAASAVQAKLEEADSAAALVQLAKQERRHTLVLLLALD